MKKIKFKMPAFSLAEALITLLIVCLITLASIPVLTKKKRDVDKSGPRGMWICTRNSSGQYVYWDMQDPHGVKDDPDTWRVTDKCSFTPPSGAARFSLTVVGGGGGGGDAQSTNVSMVKVKSGQSDSFKPDVDGFYFTEVVGAGGGGGAVVCHSDIKPAAGGGGSGAAFYGSLYLLKGATYNLYAGQEGGLGESHFHSGCNRGSNDRKRGGNGGESYFKTSGNVDTKTNIRVGGGQGADSTSYNKDNHAVGGTGGVAGQVLNAQYLTQSKSVVQLTGYSGENGAPRSYTRYQRPQGGKSVAKTAEYGRGGDGARCDGRNDEQKYSQPGYVEVSLINRYFGTGGESASPNSYFLPSIKGKIEVNIPERAESGASGGTVEAYMINNGIKGRYFRGYGAKGGKSSKDIDAPENGAHSQITMTGGGQASPSCTESKYIPAGWGAIEMPYVKCTKVQCMVDLEPPNGNAYTIEKNELILSKNINGAGTRITPAGFGSVSYNGSTITAPVHIDEDKKPIYVDTLIRRTSRTLCESYLKDTLKLYYYYTGIGHRIQSLGACTQYFPEENIGDKRAEDPEQAEFAVYDNASEIYNQYCFRDSNITYKKVCTDEQQYSKTITGYHSATYTPAYCSAEQQGGNGKMYGAGGGGGFASETPNVASKGGKGAYGAVIIEW